MVSLTDKGKRLSVLESIDDSNWEEFFESSVAVLVLTQNSCPHCKRWTEQLTSFFGEDEAWLEVRFGEITLDGHNVDVFKERMDWLARVEYLPFTVVIKEGQLVASFPGKGIERLVKRLRRVEEVGAGHCIAD